ncbi:MAG: hypothetical protein RIR00_1730, partial [Pseudomonadota bacterium]
MKRHNSKNNGSSKATQQPANTPAAHLNPPVVPGDLSVAQKPQNPAARLAKQIRPEEEAEIIQGEGDVALQSSTSLSSAPPMQLAAAETPAAMEAAAGSTTAGAGTTAAGTTAAGAGAVAAAGGISASTIGLAALGIGAAAAGGGGGGGGGSSSTPDTTAPNPPVISAVSSDDRVNATEKAAGITVNGTAEAGSTVTVTWGGTNKIATADAQGAWSVNFSSNEVPADGATQ